MALLAHNYATVLFFSYTGERFHIMYKTLSTNDKNKFQFCLTGRCNQHAISLSAQKYLFLVSAACLQKKYYMPKCINVGGRHASPIRPERSLSPPSAVICLILFMSSQIEGMVWNDWCPNHNLVITAPLPIAAIYGCSVQESAAWKVIHSPLTFKKPLWWAPFGYNCTVGLEPSFTWDNKDQMQTRVRLGVPVGACVFRKLAVRWWSHWPACWRRKRKRVLEVMTSPLT